MLNAILLESTNAIARCLDFTCVINRNKDENTSNQMHECLFNLQGTLGFLTNRGSQVWQVTWEGGNPPHGSLIFPGFPGSQVPGVGNPGTREPWERP